MARFCGTMVELARRLKALEACHLAGDRRDGHYARLARRHKMPVALEYQQLPFPGDVTHRLRQILDPVEKLPADAGLHPVAPCALDQRPACETAPGLGDPASTDAGAARVFRGRQPELGHQLSWAGEPVEVAGIRHPDRRQFTCPVQLRQHGRIAAVGHHPIARLDWNERRRNDPYSYAPVR